MSYQIQHILHYVLRQESIEKQDVSVLIRKHPESQVVFVARLQDPDKRIPMQKNPPHYTMWNRLIRKIHAQP